MERTDALETKRFATPAEELSFLRQKVAEQEAVLAERENLPRADVARAVLRDYQEELPPEVLAPHFILGAREAEEIVLQLSPELHDAKMAELITLAKARGIKNALGVVGAGRPMPARSAM